MVFIIKINKKDQDHANKIFTIFVRSRYPLQYYRILMIFVHNIKFEIFFFFKRKQSGPSGRLNYPLNQRTRH